MSESAWENSREGHQTVLADMALMRENVVGLPVAAPLGAAANLIAFSEVPRNVRRGGLDTPEVESGPRQGCPTATSDSH
jgi:hypothetical protein